MKKEQKYIIVIEEDKKVYEGLERRTHLRHYKSETKDHDIIARDAGVDCSKIVEKGIIIDGQVMVLESKNEKHNVKVQHSIKGTLQYVLEWAVKENDWKLANKVRPGNSYNVGGMREGD